MQWTCSFNWFLVGSSIALISNVPPAAWTHCFDFIGLPLREFWKPPEMAAETLRVGRSLLTCTLENLSISFMGLCKLSNFNLLSVFSFKKLTVSLVQGSRMSLLPSITSPENTPEPVRPKPPKKTRKGVKTIDSKVTHFSWKIKEGTCNLDTLFRWHAFTIFKSDDIKMVPCNGDHKSS